MFEKFQLSKVQLVKQVSQVKWKRTVVGNTHNIGHNSNVTFTIDWFGVKCTVSK